MLMIRLCLCFVLFILTATIGAAESGSSIITTMPWARWWRSPIVLAIPSTGRSICDPFDLCGG